MSKKKKIGFWTMWISHRHYLNEVPVEGKKNIRFLRRLGKWEPYLFQIIRTGNCVSLLSTPYSITEESFWNTNHFEDLAKYVFLTFNKSFLLKVVNGAETQRLPVLLRCRELLVENPAPYREPPPDDADEELLFCYRKNAFMKEQSRFAPLYRLDAENRKDLLDAVEKRVAQFSAPLPQPTDDRQPALQSAQDPEPLDTPQAVVFLEMLRPMDGSPESTLQFIAAKVEEASFDFKLFSPVKRLANRKNPYGFNGCMAAMIDFFYQHQYFKPEYDLGQIFGAYLQYSGNSVGKFKTFLSEFRQDSHYRKYSARLKALKISKLP